MINNLFFILLGVSIIFVWTGNKSYKTPGLCTFLLALIIGAATQRISFIGLLLTGILAFNLYKLPNKNLPFIYKLGLHLIHCSIFLGFSFHVLPGFNNWKIIDNVVFSTNSIPYIMYLNIEKPIYIFLFLYFHKQVPITSYNWSRIIKGTFIGFLISFILLLLGNSWFKLVTWDPKLISYPIIFLWSIRMILDTALGEEIFFRGYLQNHLTDILPNYKLTPWIACLVASLLFGARHLPGGIPISIMAGLAGIGYGIAYLKTRKIETSTLTHFIINLIHFLLFSYPMLAIHS